MTVRKFLYNLHYFGIQNLAHRCYSTIPWNAQYLQISMQDTGERQSTTEKSNLHFWSGVTQLSADPNLEKENVFPPDEQDKDVSSVCMETINKPLMDNLSNRWMTRKKKDTFSVFTPVPLTSQSSSTLGDNSPRPACTYAPPGRPHPGSWCLIIHAVGGGGTEILFGPYLDIYCLTECSIAMQKQDPKPSKTNQLLCLLPIFSPSRVIKSMITHFSVRNPTYLLGFMAEINRIE